MRRSLRNRRSARPNKIGSCRSKCRWRGSPLTSNLIIILLVLIFTASESCSAPSVDKSTKTFSETNGAAPPVVAKSDADARDAFAIVLQKELDGVGVKNDNGTLVYSTAVISGIDSVRWKRELEHLSRDGKLIGNLCKFGFKEIRFEYGHEEATTVPVVCEKANDSKGPADQLEARRTIWLNAFQANNHSEDLQISNEGGVLVFKGDTIKGKGKAKALASKMVNGRNFCYTGFRAVKVETNDESVTLPSRVCQDVLDREYVP